jgi:predicted ATP-dependent endonuclease of OLD family
VLHEWGFEFVYLIFQKEQNMRFKSFRIVNFRGVKDTSINLSRTPHCFINALVGLNESGKTTILEAIHHFFSNPDLSQSDPNSKIRSEFDYQKMLPIGSRALFNGTIRIIAELEVEDNDKSRIDAFLKKEFGFKITEPIEDFQIIHEISFKNSQYYKTKNSWSINFFGFKSLRSNAKDYWLEGDDWLKAASFVERILPKIVYFPAALFQFPDRIMLEDAILVESNSHMKNEFYCSVLADILKSINPELSLEDHLLERARGRNEIELENLEALLVQLAQHLKKIVFSEWKKIFTNTPDYNFRIKLSFDNGQYGVEIKILTDEGLFSINERSAGFRWFFAFIMITRFRLSRSDKVLFLFDEPASNLHPNAQVQLLKSFEILSKDADIVYSTHSHYLINPMWLENTHIVRNTLNSNDIDNSPINSSITVTPYRQFVGNHPDQYYYYQPIHESLDYSPSPLEFPASVILVEGKTDFFAIKHLIEVSSNLANKAFPKIFPGGGSGSLDVLISLLFGWGKNFVILLDSDGSGNIQKERYINKFEHTVKDRIFTLEDIDPNWKNYEIEKLFMDSDKEKIRTQCFPQIEKNNKKQFHLAIQELIYRKNEITYTQETEDNFDKVLTTLQSQLTLLL